MSMPLTRGEAAARTMRVLPWLVAAALVAPLLLAVLLVGVVWLRLAPPPGHWATDVQLGGWSRPVRVSVPKLLHALTDPTLARWLDARSVQSPAGTLRLRWDAASNTLYARCSPCVVRVAAFGDEPATLASATLSLRRAGDGRCEGTLAGGDGVALRYTLRMAAMSAELRAELPPTAIASLVALLGDAVPEARHARIDGTLAARIALQLPQGRWSVEPVIEDFAVHGLGTEALAHAELPPQCPAPPRGRGVSPWLERAVIAAEDQRFAEHLGYDLVELRHAIDASQRGDGAVPARGASTITQQLARLAYTGADRSLARKVRELLYAVEMERTLGKGRILRLYLALAPWGDGLCGAEAAARARFGKSAAALDRHEAAFLATQLKY